MFLEVQVFSLLYKKQTFLALIGEAYDLGKMSVTLLRYR